MRERNIGFRKQNYIFNLISFQEYTSGEMPLEEFMTKNTKQIADKMIN